MTNSSLITVPLGKKARGVAKEFAAEQATPEKGKQVYLNTLAVYAVDSYLKWLAYDTDLEQGDCWHPVQRAIFDVADLVLPELGKLECRPILPQKTAFSISQLTTDLIGYVGVQFGKRLDEVQLLGFARVVGANNPPEEIQIRELKPLDTLIDHLEVIAQKQKLDNLSLWLENIIDEAWQTVLEVLGEKRTQLVFATRSAAVSQSVVRATRIYLEIQSTSHFLALVVAVKPKANQQRDIYLQVHPIGNQTYLPVGLKFIAMDEYGKVILQNEALQNREWLQLNIEGKQQEKFSVKIELDNNDVIWNFVI